MAINKGTLAKETTDGVQVVYPKTSADMVVYDNTTVEAKLQALATLGTQIIELETRVAALKSELDSYDDIDVLEIVRGNSLSIEDIVYDAYAKTLNFNITGHCAKDASASTRDIVVDILAKSAITSYITNNGGSSEDAEAEYQAVINNTKDWSGDDYYGNSKIALSLSDTDLVGTCGKDVNIAYTFDLNFSGFSFEDSDTLIMRPNFDEVYTGPTVVKGISNT